MLSDNPHMLEHFCMCFNHTRVSIILKRMTYNNGLIDDLITLIINSLTFSYLVLVQELQLIQGKNQIINQAIKNRIINAYRIKIENKIKQ